MVQRWAGHRWSSRTRHFRFDADGITDVVVEGRRPSSYFMPIPRARKRGGQQQFDTEWTADRIEESKFINRVRGRVAIWRQGGWQGVTPTTRALLDHWTDPDRERPLFFCQVEALETAIYLTEAAKGLGDAWIENELRAFAEDTNPGLFRIAHKMATGTGKTVVMAMLIAWNHGLGFTIPYTIDGRQRGYVPDLIVRIDDGRGVADDDLLNLIVEVSGAGRRDKAHKVAAARNQWVPAVKAAARYGRWAFVEVTDPWDAMTVIGSVVER